MKKSNAYNNPSRHDDDLLYLRTSSRIDTAGEKGEMKSRRRVSDLADLGSSV
jgi:hypothetical protein